MRVVIKGLKKSFGNVAAVKHVDLEIDEGEFLVILGPSGCGKTTTLRCVAGFETPDEGVIRIGDQTVFDAEQRIYVPPEKRGLGMVFQSYAIWPHMTVAQNVGFPLEMRRWPKQKARERISEVLRLVGMEGYEDRPATKLSGGQMQRVALARGLAANPGVLLLDEPLSNLDLKLRERLRFELKELQVKIGITAMYVTHDQTEAVTLGDRIVVMNQGEIVQIGTPYEVFTQPVNRFVADFVGATNFIEGTVVEGNGDGKGDVVVDTAHGRVLARLVARPVKPGERVYLSVRPEFFFVLPRRPDNGVNVIEGELELVTFMGNHLRCTVNVGDNVLFATTVNSDLKRGSRVYLQVEPENVLVLKE